jgi:hypothetical protein
MLLLQVDQLPALTELLRMAEFLKYLATIITDLFAASAAWFASSCPFEVCVFALFEFKIIYLNF